MQELIKKGDVIGAKEALRTSSEKGMQHFDTALYELYRAGRITLEDALIVRRFAHQPGSEDQLRLSSCQRLKR